MIGYRSLFFSDPFIPIHQWFLQNLIQFWILSLNETDIDSFRLSLLFDKWTTLFIYLSSDYKIILILCRVTWILYQ